MISVAFNQHSSRAVETSSAQCVFEFSAGGEANFYIAPVIWQSSTTFWALTQDHSLFAEYIRLNEQLTISTTSAHGNSLNSNAQVKIVGKLTELPELLLWQDVLAFVCPSALLLSISLQEGVVDNGPIFGRLRLRT